jgi:hypothetical protein
MRRRQRRIASANAGKAGKAETGQQGLLMVLL